MDEVIPCPNRGPGDEHQQHTELEVQQRQKDWQEAFHDEAAEPVGDRQRSPAEAGGLCGFLLKLTYSLGYVEIIDVLAAHLQRVFEGVSALPACWKASPKMILQSKPGVLNQIGRLERALIPFRAFVNATH